MIPLATTVATNFLPVFWHGTRTIGRIFLVLLIVGWLISPPFAYKYGKWRGIGVGDNQGYKRGYAQAIQDHPPQSYGTVQGDVINYQDGKYTDLLFFWRLGFVWKKR